jgi:phosphatidylglycerol:prolipoprotein diacylglycerol transferase
VQSFIPFPDISPIIFSIPLGGFTLSLRWYALAYIVAFLLAWRTVVWLVRRPALWLNHTPPMAEKQVEDLLTWIILGVILGGRLGFVLFYQPAYYLAHPVEIPMIWTGGMSFHGGFLGVIVAGVLWARRNGAPVASVGDSFAVSVFWGLFLVRVANFINAELWGRPADLPWAVLFPGADAQTCPPDWIGVCARHPSQLYEAALEGAVLGAILMWLALRRGWLKRPGSLTGMFFILYGAARSFVEGFRQADPQFITADNPFGHVIRFGAGPEALGLTMGQCLSLPMIAIGLVILWRARRAA